MKRLPDRLFLRYALSFVAGWTALNYFLLGPLISRHSSNGDDHVSPATAVYLIGMAGGFWLLSHLFDLPPDNPRHYDID